MGIKGGTSTGYLYGDLTLLGEGIHLGYNAYGSNGAWVNPGTSNSSRISMGYGTIGLYYGAVTGNGTAGPSNVALYMDTAGKIGIANSSPSYALDVGGTTRSQKLLGTLTNTGAIAPISPFAAQNGNPNTGGSLAQIEFQYSGGGYNHYIATRHNGAVANSQNAIDFWLYSTTTQGGSTAPGTANVNTMSVTAVGVGINCNSPAYTLDITTGSLGTTAGNTLKKMQFFSTNSNSSYLRVFENRDVNGTDWTTASTRIQQVIDVTGHGYIQFNGVSNINGTSLASRSWENAVVVKDGSPGNVGIGTWSPAYTLDVAGSANVSGKYFVGGAIQPVTYSLPNTEGTAQYIFLGTWYPSGQTGKRLNITMSCGGGYNSVNSQLAKVELIVTTANGVNPQTGTGGGSFYGAAVAINSTGLGSAASPSTFRIVQGTTTQFLIYANCLSFTGGSFYTVSLASGDSWTNSSTLYGATGPTSSTYLDVTPSFSIVSTAGNVGIGTTSPNYTLDVNGITRLGSPVNGALSTGFYHNPLGSIAFAFAGQTTACNAGGGVFGVYSTDATGSNVGGSIALGGRSYDFGGGALYQTYAKIWGVSTDGGYHGAFVVSTQQDGGLAERMRIDNFGRMGIGQNSPQYIFDVNTGSNTAIRIGPRQYVGTAADTTTYGLERSRHEIRFAGYRDALIDKISSKIVNINKQTYGGSAQQAIQSGDLAFFTSPPGTGGADDTVERMRIMDNGNVGIGTTSPAYTLDVNGNTKTSNMYVYGNPANAGVARIILGPNPSAGNLDYCSMIESSNNNAGNYQSWMKFYTHDGASSGGDPTLRMSIDNIGRVGIGQANPGYTLDVNGTVNASSAGSAGTMRIRLTPTGTATNPAGSRLLVGSIEMGNGYGPWLNTYQASGLYQDAMDFSICTNVQANDTTLAERLTVLSGSKAGGACKVGINCNVPAYTLHVSGAIYATGAITSNSDGRLKNILAPISNGLAILQPLNPVSFTMKDDITSRVKYGFIAQEISNIFPELVYEVPDEEKTLHMTYSDLIGPLVSAVKELSARLSNVEAKLAATTGS